MTACPSYRHLLAGENRQVTPSDPRWDQPLADRKGPLTVSLGDYFQAIRAFLSDDGHRMLAGALSHLAAEALGADDIRRVQIVQEKHGHYYHPARLSADTDAGRFSLVVNAALTPAGRQCLQNEYPLLKRLGAGPGAGFLPPVYGRGTRRTGRGVDIDLFLGRWFEKFHEFHLSRLPHGDRPQLRLWHPDGGVWLKAETGRRIYRRAAEILTRFYDPETGACLHPWHHAAGDFIARIDHRAVELRLVTARGYGPLLDPAGGDTEPPPSARAQNLLLFFLHTSVLMRLDRLDGLGPLVWAPVGVVDETLAGVLRELAAKPPLAGVEAPFDDVLLALLTSYAAEDLQTLCGRLLSRVAPGFRPSQEQLQRHVIRVRAAAKRRVAELTSAHP